jgi:arylsulfatase A-like enzyme
MPEIRPAAATISRPPVPSFMTVLERALTAAAAFGIVGLVAWALHDGSAETPGHAAAATRPSIVLVLTDDQRADQIARMPAVRRLAASGVSFANAYASNPLCCPSRATILTGRYSHGTGVYRNESPNGGWQAFRDDERSTVATWLRAAGYRTGLFGKYMNGYIDAGHVPAGWTRWFAFLGAPGYGSYKVSSDGVARSFSTSPSTYSTDVLAARSVEFIRTTPASSPLFLVFAPYAPHEPSTPAPRHSGAYTPQSSWRPPNFNEADVSDKPAWVRGLPLASPAQAAELDAKWARQAASLLAVDEALTSIERALRETGRLANTMIVFTSDNGAQLGSHRFVPKQAPYQESVKVPLVVRYDPLTAPRAGTVSRALVGNIDHAPSFASLAGVAAPGAEGRSFVPLLRAPSTPWRERFLLEHLKSTNAVPTFCGVVTPTHKLIEYATGERELYDLTADPFELRNRAGQAAVATVERELHTRLVRMCSPPPPGFAP